MGLFDFLKKSVSSVVAARRGTGALDDPRPQEEKDRDYESKEVVTPPAAGALQWIDKPQSQWRKFEIFDQDGSLSCVGQSTAKILGVENVREENRFIRFSARDIYTRRSNAPAGGMWFHNALEIASKTGASFESLMPSEKKNEAGMNYSGDRKVSDEQIGLIFKGGGYVGFTYPYNIDEIAKVIDSGKAVLFGFRFTYAEWNERPSVKVSNPDLHHGVAGVDRTLNGGEKCIIIDDSWGAATALNGQRIITEAFLRDRCTYAGYLTDLSNKWRDMQTVIVKPHVNFQRDLKFGETHDDVKALQDMLKFEELFPVNQESTGYYGNITAKAVLAWQKLHAVGTAAELKPLGGKVFGPKSRTTANLLYK